MARDEGVGKSSDAESQPLESRWVRRISLHKQ
jgi:hypothetical protein